MAPKIWIPEHGDAGLIAAADHIMEPENRRGPERPQISPKRPEAAGDPEQALSVAEALPGPQGQPSARERRRLKVLLRQVQRRMRRRQVRMDSRLLYWAHQSGRGPRPPIQAVRAPGRYLDLAEIRWDSDRRCWSGRPPTDALPEAA